MASISKRKNGIKIVQFRGSDGNRKTISLGKCTMKQAENVKLRVERIVSAQNLGDPVDDETARWLAKLDGELAEKFGEVGLLPQQDETTMGAFTQNYLDRRHDMKPGTRILFERTRKYLLEFFGHEKYLRDISPGDVDDYRLFLLAKPLGENTVRKHCSRAKQIFKSALRKRLIADNPFEGTPTNVQTDVKHFHFVSRDQITAVIDVAPDAEWRLIIALCRYGGLRCPSEVLSLCWREIHWDQGRFTVKSPKTEHHRGQETREVPLFPELIPFLKDVFLEVADGKAVAGELHVITRYRDSNANLRTQLERIIRRAGETPWAKPFNNMRSTRETELAEEFPMHVVTAWLGNSELVAAKHYLQTTDEHFRKAARLTEGGPSAANALQEDAESVVKSAVAPSALSRKESKARSQAEPLSDVMRPIANSWRSVRF